MVSCLVRVKRHRERGTGNAYLDEDNIRAGFSKGNCHCGANATGSAGNEGGLALEGEEGGD